MRPHSRSEEHVGEWKVTLSADTLEELFTEGARVVSRACGPARGGWGPWERVVVSAPDRATLLADWLNELLGRSEVSGRAYREVRDLRISNSRLEAEVRGQPVVDWRSPLKAATYHGLDIQERDGRWRAVVLFDV